MFQPFPSFRFHRSGASRVINNPEEERELESELDGDWRDSPAAFVDEPAPVAEPELVPAPEPAPVQEPADPETESEVSDVEPVADVELAPADPVAAVEAKPAKRVPKPKPAKVA